MDLVEAITNKRLISNKLRNYISENKKIIEKEYSIDIPENIEIMREKDFSAWIQVYASRILLKKKAKGHLSLKLFIVDYLKASSELEIINNEIIKNDLESQIS